MLDQKLFGEKLRNHRKRLGMTQEEAAAKIGISAQAVSKWEAGISHRKRYHPPNHAYITTIMSYT